MESRVTMYVSPAAYAEALSEGIRPSFIFDSRGRVT
jgi:hypothetical protein